MNITLIAAMSPDLVIGDNGKLPWHLPTDLKHFKENTVGKTIVMGRKTFDSFNGKLLPNRTHVVITRNKELFLKQLEEKGIEGVLVYTDVEEVIADLASSKELMVIGGGEIYNEFLPHATKMILTVVDIAVKGDVLFPDFDMDEWLNQGYPWEETCGETKLTFYTYIRRLK